MTAPVLPDEYVSVGGPCDVCDTRGTTDTASTVDAEAGFVDRHGHTHRGGLAVCVAVVVMRVDARAMCRCRQSHGHGMLVPDRRIRRTSGRHERRSRVRRSWCLSQMREHGRGRGR